MPFRQIKQFLSRDRSNARPAAEPKEPASPPIPETPPEAPAEAPPAPETAAPIAPPVAQMAAVLRATLQHRRDTVAIMQDLAAPLSAQTIQMVEVLRRKLPARHVFQTRPLVWLQDHLRDKGRTFHPFMLAALCILLDMEAGKLTPADVEAAVAGSRPVETSWEAVNQVAQFEGVTLDPRAWKEKFEQAGLPFPTRGEPRVFEKMVTALALIEERMSVRDPRAVLDNLVRESPAPKVEAVARVWRSFHPRQTGAAPPELEGFDAYRTWMAALGVKMDPSTLLAFCLYAEIEAGRVTPDRFLRWLAGSARLSLSPYAMQAVATALDVDLLAVTLPPLNRRQILALLGLSPAGVLQGMARDDAPDRVFRRLTAGPDEEALPGWRPSGELLLRPHVMDRIGAADLGLILSLGATVMTAWQSERDRRRVWRLLAPGADPDAPFTEGETVYRFSGRLMAELLSRTSVAAARSSQPSPDVWQDPRGGLHLRAPGGAPPAGAMEKLDLAIHAPAADGLPPLLTELTLEELLGAVEPSAGDVEKLELLRHVLPPLFAEPLASGPALNPRGMRAMRDALETPRALQTLRPVVDGKTLEHVKQSFLDPEKTPLDVHIHPSVMAGMKHPEIVEYVSLALVYELCDSELTPAAGFHRSFDRHWFRAALRNQLLALLETPDPQVRQFGCRLLCTTNCLGDNNEKLIVEYELKKQLESEEPAVAREAATSLARLALADRLPLPQLWMLKQPAEAPSPAAGRRAGADRDVPMAEVMDEIRSWHAAVSSLLGLGAPAAATRPGAPGHTPIGETMLEMSRVLAGARACLGEERREGRLGADTRLLLATESFLQDALKSVVARLQSWTPTDLAQRLAAEGGLDKLAAEMADSTLDWLAGASPAGLRAWTLDEVAVPEPLWIQQPGRGGSPLFHAYLELAMAHGVDAVRLGRLTRRNVPGAFAAELFDYKTGDFVPFLEEMRIPGQLFLSAAEQDLVAALAAAAGGRRAPGAGGYARKPGGKSPPLDAATARRLAESLLEAFQIGSGFLPQVARLLEEAAQT